MNEAIEVAEALEEFSMIDEAEGGNPLVIATERRAAELLRYHASLVEENKRMREALRRIRDATPLNTNAKDAAEMCNHTYAISASALLYNEDRSNA